MMPLDKFLHERIMQRDHRLMMIPRYVERPGNFVGKKDFTLADLPKIKYEIEEAKVALKAVQRFHAETKLAKESKT